MDLFLKLRKGVPRQYCNSTCPEPLQAARDRHKEEMKMQRNGGRRKEEGKK